MTISDFLDKWMPITGNTSHRFLEDRGKMESDLNSLLGGLIERKRNCPNCGPKFEKSYKRFQKEVKRELQKEAGK